MWRFPGKISIGTFPIKDMLWPVSAIENNCNFCNFKLSKIQNFAFKISLPFWCRDNIPFNISCCTANCICAEILLSHNCHDDSVWNNCMRFTIDQICCCTVWNKILKIAEKSEKGRDFQDHISMILESTVRLKYDDTHSDQEFSENDNIPPHCVETPTQRSRNAY